MDDVIERLAAGDVESSDRTEHLMLIMLARILMTNMAIAGALSELSAQEDMDVDHAGQAGWGGLDG